MDRVNSILDKIVVFQNDNGGFNDEYGENLFISGLALEILLYKRAEHRSEIEKLVGYLLSKQYEDGSWSNSHSLQIPDPAKTEPTNELYSVSSYGTSVRAKEFNRLFTTSCILKSLTDYYG